MNKEKYTNPLTIFLLAGICCLLWGSAFPCVKLSYSMFSITLEDTSSQILFAGTRFFLSGILIILINLFTGKFLIPAGKSIKSVFKLSLVQTVLQYLFFYIGLANTTGVKSSILETSNVFFAILIPSLLLKREKLTLNRMAGCIIGFSGVVAINLIGSSVDFSFKMNGELFILISALMYAVSSVMVKEYSKEESPVTLSAYQFLTGGFIMIVIGLIMGGRLVPTGFTSFIMLTYLAFISAVAYSLWSTLLKYNPVGKVAVYGFLNPVFGVILSALFLNEYSILNIYSLLCLLLVSFGIYLANRESEA